MSELRQGRLRGQPLYRVSDLHNLWLRQPVQRHRESVIVEQVNKALAAKAEQLGQHPQEPPKKGDTRSNDRLEKLNDPDLAEAIAASLISCATYWLLVTHDRERVAALAEPEAWAKGDPGGACDLSGVCGSD